MGTRSWETRLGGNAATAATGAPLARLLHAPPRGGCGQGHEEDRLRQDRHEVLAGVPRAWAGGTPTTVGMGHSGWAYPTHGG
jgi:hypothetical protein